MLNLIYFSALLFLLVATGIALGADQLACGKSSANVGYIYMEDLHMQAKRAPEVADLATLLPDTLRGGITDKAVTVLANRLNITDPKCFTCIRDLLQAANGTNPGVRDVTDEEEEELEMPGGRPRNISQRNAAAQRSASQRRASDSMTTLQRVASAANIAGQLWMMAQGTNTNNNNNPNNNNNTRATATRNMEAPRGRGHKQIVGAFPDSDSEEY